MDLAGRVALVTGAGKGIGRGIALCLAAEGAKVIVNYNSSEEGAREVKARIEEIGGEAFIYRADVSKKDEVFAMVEKAIARFGRLDILVNNSALQKNLDIAEYTEEAYDLIMDVNLKGYLLSSQAVLPHMKALRFGRIINISSVHSKRPTQFDAVYAMTKGGIKMFTRECAIEFAQYGITVNTIEPAAVQIGVKSGNPGPIRHKRVEKTKHFNRYPMGRIGVPEDVGYMVSFLASEKSAFITGSAIRMDGAAMLL